MIVVGVEGSASFKEAGEEVEVILAVGGVVLVEVGVVLEEVDQEVEVILRVEESVVVPVAGAGGLADGDGEADRANDEADGMSAIVPAWSRRLSGAPPLEQDSDTEAARRAATTVRIIGARYP